VAPPSKEVTVRREPRGSAVVRFLDKEGKPRKGYRAVPSLVIRPGEKEQRAANLGVFAEAEQFEVPVLYNQLLQRDADANGLAHFTSELEQGATREQVTAQILGSDEYFSRF
jgi:hypothetical protein